MKVYASDEEQLKALSKWWKQNKTSTIRLMITILLMATAYNLYRYNQASASRSAAATYYNIIASVSADDIKLAKSQIDTMQHDYASSSYAALSSLIAAKILVDEGSYDDAIKQLTWVIDHGDKSLHDIAYLRIARLNLQLNKPYIALATIAKVTNKPYLAEKNIVLGDIYLQLKNTSEAKEAYKTAMQNADKSKTYELWELASMKYNNLSDN